MSPSRSPIPGNEQQLFAQARFPEIYEQELVGPLFLPFAELMLEDMKVLAGDRVLDIACGTGIVARLAKARIGDSGKVVGVDRNPAMLAMARRVAAGIDWREGDASALPVSSSEQFDVVSCQQGFQFFADKPAVVRQMRHVLAAGGRLVVSTWRSDEEFPLIRALRSVTERHIGPIIDQRHSFGDPGPLEALLRDGGFTDVRSKIVSRTVRFPDPSVFPLFNARALVAMSKGAQEMRDEHREQLITAILRDSAEIVRPYTDEAGLAFELRANVVTASG
jgi:SAM-dependent methyltransferase